MRTLSRIPLVAIAGILASLLTAGSPRASAQAFSRPPLKQPIPLEQTISQVRKHHGNIVILNARLAEEDRRTVRIIDFRDSNNNRHRMVIDAFTGKELELVPLKTPLPIEKALEKIRTRHQTAKVLRSWLDKRDGNSVRIIEFIDRQHKRWQTTLDAYTGMIIDERMFDLKPTGKQIALSQIIEKAREKHKGMVVLQTRLTHRKGTQVREIYFLDENSMRRRMTVNATTGEVIADKMVPGTAI